MLEGFGVWSRLGFSGFFHGLVMLHEMGLNHSDNCPFVFNPTSIAILVLYFSKINIYSFHLEA